VAAALFGELNQAFAYERGLDGRENCGNFGRLHVAREAVGSKQDGCSGMKIDSVNVRFDLACDSDGTRD
jgi:hypothetical protein